MGATAFVLAGSAALGLPGTASAETKSVPCGSTVTAKPGDTIKGTTPLLGIPLDLGVVGQVSGVLTGTINALLGTVCQVTVKVVDAVVAPVPVVGAPAASALNQATSGVTGAVQNGVSALSGKPAAGSPGGGTGGSPQQPPSQGGSPQGGTPPGMSPFPVVNSPLLPGAFTPDFGGLPWSFSTGYSPMRDYSGIPMATAGLFTPSPGLRYGSQIPGYAPQYGLSNPSTANGGSDIQNAGQAQALPSAPDGFTDGASLPVLIAVLALSGVTAGLVRSWVLRRMAAAN